MAKPPIQPSGQDIITELHRELRLRAHVYARQIAEGKLPPEIAEHRCRCLRQAIADVAAFHGIPPLHQSPETQDLFSPKAPGRA